MNSQTISTWANGYPPALRIVAALTVIFGVVFLLAVGAEKSAAALVVVCFLFAYLVADLETCLLITIPAALVDPQIVIGGQRLYCDILFVFLCIPLLRTGVLSRGLLLLPFVIYSVATGALIAINHFWFMAFSLRLITAVVLCAAVCAIRDTGKILRVLCVSSIPISLFGIYQTLVQDYGGLYFAVNRGFFEYEAWRGRAFSVFATDNVFGGFCAIIATVSLGLLLKQRNRLMILCCGLSVIGMMASGSRGAWVGFAAGTIYYIVKNRPKLIPVYVGMLTVMAVAIFQFLPDRLNLEQFIIETRLELWGAALALFNAHPVVGVGLTNFVELMPTIIPWEHDIVGAHNLYLQVLAEGGVLGFCSLFVPILWVTRRSSSKVAVAGLIASFSHQLADYLWNDPRYLMVTAIIIGSIAASSKPNLPQEPG